MLNAKINSQGWLRTYLETQMHGLTVYMDQADFPFNKRFLCRG